MMAVKGPITRTYLDLHRGRYSARSLLQLEYPIRITKISQFHLFYKNNSIKKILSWTTAISIWCWHSGCLKLWTTPYTYWGRRDLTRFDCTTWSMLSALLMNIHWPVLVNRIHVKTQHTFRKSKNIAFVLVPWSSYTDDSLTCSQGMHLWTNRFAQFWHTIINTYNQLQQREVHSHFILNQFTSKYTYEN